MQIFFIDESGTPPKSADGRARYFVLAGLTIPDGAWAGLRDAFQGLKTRRGLRGEIKWRYFSPNNGDKGNPMRGMDFRHRDEIRADLFDILAANSSIRCIAAVVSAEAAYSMPSINGQADVYNLAYKALTERFQYYLQDLGKQSGRIEYGIVVADHRGREDDAQLRTQHQKLLFAGSGHISSYRNLIEGLFLAPSHQSVGIQFADLVAGAVWRRFEKSDSRWFEVLEPTFRRGPAGQIDGFGVVKVPKANWR